MVWIYMITHSQTWKRSRGRKLFMQKEKNFQILIHFNNYWRRTSLDMVKMVVIWPKQLPLAA